MLRSNYRSAQSSGLAQSCLGLAIVLLMGSLGSCANPAPNPPSTSPRDFRNQVVQQIGENFTASEAEVYLTRLGDLSDGAIAAYGDRACESFRRGRSLQQMMDTLQEQFPAEEPYITHLQIVLTAQQQRCPESSFPAPGWQRWSLFLAERLNGGDPL